MRGGGQSRGGKAFQVESTKALGREQQGGQDRGARGLCAWEKPQQPTEDSTLWPACHMRGEPQGEGQREVTAGRDE